MLPAPQTASPAVLEFDEVLALDDEGAVRKLAAGWIDLGGIAKGYAVDLAVESLLRAGVDSGCVNAGGDLRVFGALRMPVAIRSPRDPGAAASVLQLEDCALATSGSYISSREVDGRTVSALVDARDGTPLVAARSASVCAPRCVLADALAKVVLATGDLHHPALSACEASAYLF
jgi:thiamine biosynthesis lipoprotein